MSASASSETQVQAQRLIDEVLVPLLEADGGQLVACELDEQGAHLELGGACIGCPGFHFTRHHVIEALLRPVLGASARIEVVNVRRAGS
ncbi:MAG: NifU family protein [Polyangiales bacterium]